MTDMIHSNFLCLHSTSMCPDSCTYLVLRFSLLVYHLQRCCGTYKTSIVTFKRHFWWSYFAATALTWLWSAVGIFGIRSWCCLQCVWCGCFVNWATLELVYNYESVTSFLMCNISDMFSHYLFFYLISTESVSLIPSLKLLCSLVCIINLHYFLLSLLCSSLLSINFWSQCARQRHQCVRQAPGGSFFTCSIGTVLIISHKKLTAWS